jgi:hypothetical protein
MHAISAIRARVADSAAPPDRTPDADTVLIPPTLIGRVAPAVTRTRRSRGSERYYVGRRPRDTEVYVVTDTDTEPLEHPGYRSNAPLDWGDLTAGALELAFAMLAHTTDSRPPDPICLTFWAEVVARLDHAGFVLADGDIALWLLTAFREGDGSRDESPLDRSGSLRTRAVSWFRSRLGRR